MGDKSKKEEFLEAITTMDAKEIEQHLMDNSFPMKKKQIIPFVLTESIEKSEDK